MAELSTGGTPAGTARAGDAGAPGAPGDGGSAPPQPPPRESVKDTLISIVIAFALAFVFRGFVVEAFVIPTGSMAPTLMGAHMRFRAEQSGYSWPVGPWFNGPDKEPAAIQGDGKNNKVYVHDPMTGDLVTKGTMPRRAGDRILVLKYLYTLMEPERFDVVVFKNPAEPQVNFIKRLIGLPGEEIALVDGDVFVRKTDGSGGGAASSPGTNSWAQPGWKIARKPERVQRAVWQRLFDSDYAPLNPMRDGRRWYNPPWVSADAGWKGLTEGHRIYEFTANGRTDLVWDENRPKWAIRDSDSQTWRIDDYYPYDETPLGGYVVPQGVPVRFPVSDVRLSAAVEAAGDGLHVQATVAARAHEFQMDLTGTTAAVRFRPAPLQGQPEPAWQTLGTGTIAPIKPGRVVGVEFWHVDQSLQAWVDGRLVAGGFYDWGPADRIRYATGRTVDELLATENRDRLTSIFATTTHPEGGPGISKETYQHPRLSWTFDGAPFVLRRVSVDRDLHYQPAVDPSRTTPARGTHPEHPVVLNADQFFCCGDNSPASSDGRLWADVDPWVAREIDGTLGVVPRELMMGKAFFVYFPSLLHDGGVPAPDFGRMRFIW